MKGKSMAVKKWLILVVGIFVFYAESTGIAGDSKPAAIPQVPIPGMVTMLDLGAHKCIPCKMMAPIIKELQEEYKGRASVIFIDVWEHQEQAKRFGIRGIPTQIFYDKEGREVGRHIGFLDKKSIVEVFEKLGVPRETGK